MASKLGTNTTKIIFGLIAFVLLIIVINTSNKPNENTGNTTTNGQGTGTNDVTGDNVEETLNKVSSQYVAQQQKTQALEQQLAAVQAQLKERNATEDPEAGSRLKQIVEDEISKLRDDFGQLHHDVTGNQPPTLESSDQPSDTQRSTSPINPTTARSGYIVNGGDLAGLGWDNSSSNQDPDQAQRLRSRLPGYATIVPLSDKTPESLAGATQAIPTVDSSTSTQSFGNDTQQEVKPYRTIPARSTLLRAKAVTALVGRIPVSGRIEDPYPVKVIVGSQNLAASGHRIHGLQGIIFDGTAKGDWTLSCISVDIIGGTFIFDDGRIQQLTRNNGESIESATASQSQSIGYISNPHGLPCIRGKRFTNAYEQAGFLALLNYGSSRFNARAQNETTNVVSGTTGTTTSSVTGDNTAFETNSAVASSIAGVRDIQEARAQNGIDVIAAPAGRELAIHITHDLYIDYDPNARRLHYADSHQTHYQPTRLD